MIVSPPQRIKLAGWNVLWTNSDRRLLSLGGADAIPFRALLQAMPAFGLTTEISDDPREKTVLEVLEPGPCINRNDTLIEPGTNNQWTVLGRDNNQSDFTVRYFLAKITTEDNG